MILILLLQHLLQACNFYNMLKWKHILLVYSEDFVPVLYNIPAF